MKHHFPGLLRDKTAAGTTRWRVRVEGSPNKKIRIPCGPGEPGFHEHYYAARVGEALETVLAGFAGRIPAEETALFRNAVVISHQVGGDLAGILDTLSMTLRERAQVEERIDALTAMGRMQGRVMAVLPLAIGAMLYIQQPALMGRLFSEPLGWLVLGTVSIMMALALVSIRRIVAIDV